MRVLRTPGERFAELDGFAYRRVTMRDKESICTLRLRDGIFVLATMHWPDEIRPFSLADVDSYREGVQEGRQAKVDGQEVVVQPEE